LCELELLAYVVVEPALTLLAVRFSRSRSVRAAQPPSRLRSRWCAFPYRAEQPSLERRWLMRDVQLRDSALARELLLTIRRALLLVV
jgi:hypothetical protein